MRRSQAMWIVVVLGACSVPDKQRGAPETDGGLTPPVDALPAPPEIDAPPDLTAPETMLDLAPDAFSHEGQATFRFSSNEPSATFACRIDAELSEVCRSPYARTLADGPHSFSVRAIDAAGNSDDTPAEKVWTIDTVAPDTTLTDGPPSADNSVMATFAFRSAERNVFFDCSLDSAGFLPCVSGAAFGPVGDGTHSFLVRARDRAGNIDPSPAVYAWTVNTSTPDTTVQSGPDAASPTTDAMFMFFSPDAGAGATFTCALDGAGFTACTSPKAYDSLAEGAHTFAVRVRDAIGNVDPSPATRTWTVDLTPPNTTISDGPVGAVPVASASLTFTASEADVTFACSLDGVAITDCASPASLTGLAQGAHTFTVQATDAAGHADPSPASRSWTVDTVAPDVMVTAGPAATSGPRVSFSFTTSEGSLACSFDGAAFTACTSPLATNLPAGVHQLAVRATDAAGNATTVTRAWTVACAPPDTTGAAGLLHLDDTTQSLANAVVGGAAATLGDTIAVEAADPTPLPAARFGGGLTFPAASDTHVAWPIALAAMPEMTIELWAQPSSVAVPRAILVSGDGRVVLRVTAVSPTTVKLSIAVVEGGTGGVTRTVSSTAVAAGAWHHVIASLQQPTLRLWVDGVRSEIGTVTLGPPLAFDALQLGGDGTAAYDGALDEVWIAQTAITEDEAALARYCPL
ncbi:MAG: LamG domain-containing protein [Kofleriaceae bacterium]